MDELCEWLRAEVLRGRRGLGPDPWDSGWYCAIEEVIHRIPDFRDPPPVFRQGKDISENSQNAADYRVAMDAWVKRNADSAKSESP